MIRATLTVLGKEYEGKGKTVLEALEGISPPKLPPVKAILKVKKTGKGTEVVERERILQNSVVSRVFSISPMTREVALKQVSTLFDL